jgi:hypothetical protein
MTPKQEAMIAEALEQAADKAQNAMLHAQTALIDLKYTDLTAARARAKLVCRACSKAQSAAAGAFVLLDYVNQPGDEN